MYTAYMGKRLLEAIENKTGEIYTPRRFFDEVYYPLFFKNEKFLLDTNNAPPGQAYKQQKKTPLTPEVIEKQRYLIHQKIDGGNTDASIFLGGPSSDQTATTSGQVTAIHRSIPAEDVYASWIGTGLGALVEGGLSLLIDDDDALLALYEGWKVYREYLDRTKTLKPHQINTWNGQWLTYRFSKLYNPVVNPSWGLEKGDAALSTEKWPRFLFALSYHYRKTPNKILTAYVYSFGQMNRTMGFVRLDLPEVNSLAELLRPLFSVPEGSSVERFEDLYNTDFSFKRVCQAVSVGKRALQPKDMREYIEGKKTPSYNDSDATKKRYFQIQETWIIAMLSNKDLPKRAAELAQALYEASKDKTNRGKNENQNKVNQILASTSIIKFVDGLTAIIDENGGASGDLFDQTVEDVVTMSPTNVPLFLTLIRFKYAYITRKVSPRASTSGEQDAFQEETEPKQ